MVFISFGLYLTSCNYIEGKNIKTAHKPSIDIAKDLSKNILNRVLNYEGKSTVDTIINAFVSNNVDLRQQRMKDISRFVLMDLVYTAIMLSSTAYVIYQTNDVILTPVIYVSMKTICDKCWSIVSILRSMSESSSSWGPLESCIEKYHQYESFDNSIDVSDILEKNETEIQLYGKSGCGKTTLMKRKVISTFVNCYPGQYIYMDQFMTLFKSNRTIIEIMTDNLPHRMNHVNELLEFAKSIDIDNIINANTLNTAFIKPSGGEKKRIMILRSLLPVLLNMSPAKIVFNDEITSGIDHESWLSVRSLIEKLQCEGVRFITIDHHDTSIKKRTVYKRVVDGDLHVWI